MNFHTRKWVKPEDLNPNGTLFGGSLLRWIDEEAAIYAICQLDNQRVVTKFMSEINFVSSARQGDIIELGMTATHFGRTSITLRCEVRNKITRKSILTVEKMVFVNLDEKGEPMAHGRTQIRYADEAFARYRGDLRPAAQGAGAVGAGGAGADGEGGAARGEVESLH
ncbi:hotdog domain-containing protein [Paraburkholderia fungorum]|uniref:acyl-CoA thioesterase n=1 Tax=Paraburkholderia fungorum TaxID=134537 RepID=UPI0038B6D709